MIKSNNGDNGGDDEVESRDSREWDDSSGDGTQTNSNPQAANDRATTATSQPRNSLLPSISDNMPLRQIPAPMKSVARYVETSLDDLSFASTSSGSSSCDKESGGLDNNDKINPKPIIMHATVTDQDQEGSRSSDDENQLRAMQAASGLRNNSSATVPTTPTNDLHNEQQIELAAEHQRPASSAASLSNATRDHKHDPTWQDRVCSDDDDTNDDDEIPPEVPARRSSRVASHKYALVNPRLSAQRINSRATIDSQRNSTVAPRPPLPPVPPIETQERRDSVGVEIARAIPKNVWSPSGSSVASSSFGSQSLSQNQQKPLISGQDPDDLGPKSQKQLKSKRINATGNVVTARKKNPPPPPPPRSQQTKLQGGSIDSATDVVSQSSASMAPTIVELQASQLPVAREANLARDADKLADEALSAAMRVPAIPDDDGPSATNRDMSQSERLVEPHSQEAITMVSNDNKAQESKDDVCRKPQSADDKDVTTKRATTTDKVDDNAIEKYVNYDLVGNGREQATAPSANQPNQSAHSITLETSKAAPGESSLEGVTSVHGGQKSSSSTSTKLLDGVSSVQLTSTSEPVMFAINMDQESSSSPLLDDNNKERVQRNDAVSDERGNSHNAEERWTLASSAGANLQPKGGQNVEAHQTTTTTTITTTQREISGVAGESNHHEFDDGDDDSYADSDLDLDLDLDMNLNVEQGPLERQQQQQQQRQADVVVKHHAHTTTDTNTTAVADDVCGDQMSSILQLDHKRANRNTNNAGTEHANNNNNNNYNNHDGDLSEGEVVACKKSHVTHNTFQQPHVAQDDDCLMVDYDTMMSGAGGGVNDPTQAPARDSRELQSMRKMEPKTSYKIPLHDDEPNERAATLDKHQEVHSSSLGRVSHHQTKYLQQLQRQQQQAENPREKWFQRMYSQMHAKPNLSSASSKFGPKSDVNSLLQAVNSQPQDSTNQICVKLKSPKTDHRFSPSYFSEEDFDQFYGSKSRKPGSISDYEPGRSSIITQKQQDQHERNLNLYFKLIEHIDEIFSSVLPELQTSRSIHTLNMLSKRLNSAEKPQSKSGPQTPVARRTTSPGFHESQRQRSEANLNEAAAAAATAAAHQEKCVFERLLATRDDSAERECNYPLPDAPPSPPLDPHRQYLAVQQGSDIPLRGLRMSLPDPSCYRVAGSLERPVKIFSANDYHSMSNGKHFQPTNQHMTLSLERPRSELPATSYAQYQSQQQHQTKANAPDACWPEEFYRDFDALYRSMCLHDVDDKASTTIGGIAQVPQLNKSRNSTLRQTSTISSKLPQQINLNDNNQYLFNHEEQQQQNLLFHNLSSTMIMPRSPSDFGLLQSPPVATASAQQPAMQQHPQILQYSHGNSFHEGTISPSGRADSRDTYQSLRDPGPALVEEMTLTDLEDEISFSLMASRDMQRTYSHRKKRHSSSLKSSSAGSSHQNQRQPMLESVDHHYQENIAIPPASHRTPIRNTNPISIGQHHYQYNQPQPSQRQHLDSIMSSNSNSYFSPILKSDLIRYQRPLNR